MVPGAVPAVPAVAHRCDRVIQLADGEVIKDERNARRKVQAEGGQLSAGTQATAH